MARKRTAKPTAEQPPPGLKLRHTLRGHEGWIGRLAWSPDGRRLATPSEDKTIKTWDVETGDLLGTLRGHAWGVTSVAWSPTSKGILASTSWDNSIRLWNVDTNQQCGVLAEDVNWPNSLAWTPDGELLASSSWDGQISIWNTARVRLVNTLAGPGEHGTSLVWIPGDKVLAAGSFNENTVWLWRRMGATASVLAGHTGSVYCVSSPPDGRILASSSEDNTIRIWQSKSGFQLRVLEGHSGPVSSVSFSFDGRLLASKSTDSTVKIWRCDAWEVMVTLHEEGSEFWPPSLAFHPTRPVLATLGEKDTVVRIWDLDYEQLLGAPSEAPSIHYTNAKAVLLGETSTGKTCLARALMGEPFEPQESTHGMKIWSFHTETTPRKDGGQTTRETMLWDLAGQVDYQVVHQLFLDETVLGIVMFDPTHPENPFSGVGHWEKALARVAGEDCARLLVAGRVDRGHPTATNADIESFRERHGYRQFVATSAKTGKGVAELREAIRDAIPWERMPVTTSPRLWKQIREYLIKRRQGRNVVTTRENLKRDFRRKHKGAEFTDADFDTVVLHAQAQGLVWRLSYGDLVLMKPEVLNDYAAAVVRAARKHPEGLGCAPERDVLDGAIDFEDLKRLSSDPENKLLYAVVELCLDREVALRGGPNDEHLVFPSKFNRKLPDIPQPPAREVAYRFAGPVEDIYATLAVRLYYSDAFQLKDLWKNAAEYLDARKRICGFELTHSEEGEGVISAFFQQGTSVDTKVLFLRFIHEHLQQRAVRDSVVRERIYRCPNCTEEATNRKAINFRLQQRHPTITCQFCDEAIELSDVLEAEFGDPKLLERVREMDERVAVKKSQAVGITVAGAKESIGEYDVFLAHNSADKPQVEQIADALRKRRLNPWLDKERIPPGRWFQDVIQRAIGEVKSAAIIIGHQGLGRWQLVELRSFISQCVDRDIPVIPVLLPGVKKVPKELVFLSEFNWVRFRSRVDDIEALDNLEWGITGEHPRPRAGYKSS